MRSDVIVCLLILYFVTLFKVLASHPCSAMNKHGLCSHLCIVTAMNESTNNNNYECSCPLGLIMINHQCVTVPVCDSDHFLCNTECIPLLWHCDGQKDCHDGSDEVNCLECNKHQFRCLDGHCIGITMN